MRDAEIRQIYQPSYYQGQEYESFQMEGFKFNVPTNWAYNFDVPLPALTIYQLEDYDRLGIFPKMRGESLKDGFVWKYLSEEEKKELKNIIEKMKKRESVVDGF